MSICQNNRSLKIKLKDILVLFTFLIFTGFFWKNEFRIGALFVIALETGIIIIKAKYSFFSVFAFLINYCFLMEYFVFSNRYVYGILSLNYVKIYYFEMFICCSAFNLILIVFIDVMNIAKKEKNIYGTQFNISKNATTIYCIIAIIITFLIFPFFPTDFYFTNSRFSGGIIPFSGWSCIPFFFVAISILGRKKRRTVYFTALFIIFWYVLHGERVEAMGLIVFIIVWLYNTVKISRQKKIEIAGIGLTSILCLTAVGIIRVGGNMSLKQLVTNIFVQTTACDVTNVFNCAVDLYKKSGGYHGTTYLSYLINCIPYRDDQYQFSRQLISDGYRSAGGGHFLAEPYANGGILIVIIEIIILMSVLYYLIKKNSLYRTLIYVELFLAVFRIAWYGLNYMIVTILYFVPFSIFINKILQMKQKIEL